MQHQDVNSMQHLFGQVTTPNGIINLNTTMTLGYKDFNSTQPPNTTTKWAEEVLTIQHLFAQIISDKYLANKQEGPQKRRPEYCKCTINGRSVEQMKEELQRKGKANGISFSTTSGKSLGEIKDGSQMKSQENYKCAINDRSVEQMKEVLQKTGQANGAWRAEDVRVDIQDGSGKDWMAEDVKVDNQEGSSKDWRDEDVKATDSGQGPVDSQEDPNTTTLRIEDVTMTKIGQVSCPEDSQEATALQH